MATTLWSVNQRSQRVGALRSLRMQRGLLFGRLDPARREPPDPRDAFDHAAELDGWSRFDAELELADLEHELVVRCREGGTL